MSGWERFFYCWFIPVAIALYYRKNDPDKESYYIIVFPPVSIFGWFYIPAYLIRAYKSRLKCTFGHDYELVYDSEARKWANGKRPFRASVGGREDYKCTKCSKEKSIRWSVF